MILEIRGFEPLTYGLQSRRSSQLSYIPLATLYSMYKKRRKRKEEKRNALCTTNKAILYNLSLRKEVIQPHLPVRLPCYDFTLLTKRTFGTVPLCRLDKRLRVPPTRMV